MSLATIKSLQIGDEVRWTERDATVGTTLLFVQEILTKSGRVEGLDTVLVLGTYSDDDETIEASVSELI